MEPTEARRRSVVTALGQAVLLALTCAAAPPPVDVAWDTSPPPKDAVLREDLEVRPVTVASLAVWGEHLVAVTGDGHLGAWRSSDLADDAALGEALGPVEAVGTADGELLGLTGDGVAAWNPTTRAWSRRYPLPKTSETVERFVTWPGGVAVVYVDHVFEARRQRAYPVPLLEDARGESADLELRDALGEGAHLWLGDSQGQHGGHLLGLDLETGRWTTAFTPEPVVALAPGADGGVVVATSVNRERAGPSTLQVAGPQGTLARSLATLEGAAFQKLARGRDGSLWALEQRRLARVDEAGRLQVVAAVGPLGHEVYPVVGGISGMLALEAVDGRTWAVLPRLGPVVVVRDGVARPLASPARPTPRYLPVASTAARTVSWTLNGAVAEALCDARTDRRDRWSFVGADGTTRAADSCAFPLPGAPAELLRRPLQPGRWVASDARGRVLEVLEVEVGRDGAVVLHAAGWQENGQQADVQSTRVRPCCAELGVERFHHRSGRLAGERHFEAGVLEGRFTRWHVNGVRARTGTFLHGRPAGTWTAWYPSGQKRAEERFREGRLHGTVTEWDRDGRRRRERSFVDGVPRAVREWDTEGRLTERAPRPGDEQHPL